MAVPGLLSQDSPPGERVEDALREALSWHEALLVSTKRDRPRQHGDRGEAADRPDDVAGI